MGLSVDENPLGYGAVVWRYFHDRRHAGRFDAGAANVIAAQAGTPATRAVLRLEARTEAGRVTEARFQVYGCPTSIAVGAWLAEWLPGKSAGEIAAVRASALREALEIPEDRAHCALMGEDASRALADALGRPQHEPASH